MGWQVGYDSRWGRDIGYGVPALCDSPKCLEKIDRGLSYVCGGDAYGGEHGCGLYFCDEHLWMTARRPQRCSRCLNYRPPYDAKPDLQEWTDWKATDPSWAEWRAERARAAEKAVERPAVASVRSPAAVAPVRRAAITGRRIVAGELLASSEKVKHDAG